MADSNLHKLVETALENLKTMTDANTVVGKPIEVSGGSVIIPVSKVMMGFTSGGIDYNSKTAPEKAPNFGGGTGTGFTVAPVAFLVVDPEGNVNLLNIADGKSGGGGGTDLVGTITGLVDKAPSMIEKITKIFKKDKADKNNKNDKNDTENADKAGESVVLNNEDVENFITAKENAENKDEKDIFKNI